MKLKIILPGLIFVLLNLLQPESVSARNAPFTTAGSSSVCPGGTAIVPVTVSNFSFVKAITLRLDFDPTQMSYVEFTNLNPLLSDAAVQCINVGPNLSKIIVFWTSFTSSFLPDGAVMMNLNFKLTTGSPNLIFNNSSNSGGDCEYADENMQAMIDTPTDTYYFNSTITNLGVTPAGPVAGVSTLCAGSSNVPYTVAPIANATSYLWTLPAGGTIVAGDNTNSIVVDYSNSSASGDITVAGTNICGPGTSSSLAITVNPLPVPALTGQSMVCEGATGVYTTEPGMAGYIWAVSAGGTILGSGLNNVTVSWNAAGVQSVSVNYTNANGCSSSSPSILNVTVSPIPNAAVVTAVGAVLTSSAPSGNQWYYEGNLIPGATGQTYTVTSNTGYYWCLVTLNGCSSPISNKVWVVITGQNELTDNSFRIYPIPNDGRFTLSLTTSVPESFCMVVYNQLGEKIFELNNLQANGIFEKQIDLRPITKGIYSVVLTGKTNKVVRKILIDR